MRISTKILERIVNFGFVVVVLSQLFIFNVKVWAVIPLVVLQYAWIFYDIKLRKEFSSSKNSSTSNLEKKK